MKKIILMVIMCVATGTIMAQKVQLALLGNTINNSIIAQLKPDSSWRLQATPVATDQLLKQNDIDINKMYLDSKMMATADLNKTFPSLAVVPNSNLYMPQVVSSSNAKMPVTLLQGNSKMPVVVLQGNSKMPIAGYHHKKTGNTNEVAVP
jgi:hypothetical protein